MAPPPGFDTALNQGAAWKLWQRSWGPRHGVVRVGCPSKRLEGVGGASEMPYEAWTALLRSHVKGTWRCWGSC